MPQNDKAQELSEKFKKWRTALRPYWDQIQKNRELYEFYKSEASITDSDVSLNSAFAIVESLVAKQNEAALEITVKARGENNMRQVEQYVSDTLKNAIEDPNIAEYFGPFRKFRETSFRSFLVDGNVVGEQKYAYQKNVVDNPYACQLPLFSVIFDPTKTLSTSSEYFVEKYVSYSYLKDNQYNRESEKGLYKNLSKLRASIKEDNKDIPDVEDRLIAGDQKLPRKVGEIHLLEHWKGSKLTVVANNSVIIREVDDPYKTGTHPLVFAMLYSVEGRPYAYGKMDAIYKVVRAQDTIVNQKIESINRFLRPTVLIKDPGMDIVAVQTILESGGVGFGDAQMVQEIARTLPPNAAFQETQELQQAVERAALYSPYAAGATSQTTDQTKGTASGIKSLQAAAEPNFQIILDTFQDMYIQPLMRKFLKSIAALMEPNAVRDILTTGEKPQWVQATRGLLNGKIKLKDLVTIGLMTDAELYDFTHTMEEDELGNPIVTPIIGADEEVAIDTDWIISVSLTNNANNEKQQRLNDIANWAQFAQKSGVPVDMQKISMTLGNRIDDFEPEDYILEQPNQGIMGASMGGMNQPQQPPMMPPQMPPEAPTIPQMQPQSAQVYY